MTALSMSSKSIESALPPAVRPAGQSLGRVRCSVLADPDFDHARPLRRREFATTVAVAQRRPGDPFGSTRCRAIGRPCPARRPNRGCSPALTAYTRHAPQMFLQAQASEAHLQSGSGVRGWPGIQHARIFSDPEAGQTKAYAAMQNPLLRCGLVLSGANQPARTQERSQDDGIVTGLDVLETDLRGTNL